MKRRDDLLAGAGTLALFAATLPPSTVAAPVLVRVEATLNVKLLIVLLAPLISKVPVSTSVSAVIFTVALLVSVVPAATSREPLPLKVRAVVKPAVVNKVPPPKVTALPASPRLLSAPADNPPTLSEMPPLTVFAPERINVPAPDLVKPVVPVNCEEIVVVMPESVVMVLAPAFAPLRAIVLPVTL